MSPNTTIVLMSYNRPEYICEAINSILKQSYKNLRFVVSDNSTKSDVQILVQNNFPNIKYTKRTPSMNMSAHWNLIISEIETDYFMMFHDDDLMNNNCVAELINTLEKNPHAIACSGNAKIIRNKNLSEEMYNKCLSHEIVFKNTLNFGQRYFDPTQGGVNPFPGYMYRTSLTKKLRFSNREAGKHSDVTFLFKALELGPIIWIPTATMNYRIHSSNDSVGVDILSLSNLVKFYLKKSNLEKNDKISRDFLMKNYILWLKDKKWKSFKFKHPFRFKVIIFAIVNFYLTHPARLVLLFCRHFSK